LRDTRHRRMSPLIDVIGHFFEHKYFDY